MCTKDAECFGNSTDVSCTSGFCKTTKMVNDSCANYTDPDTQTFYEGSKWCSSGLYCYPENNTCQMQFGENEECTQFDQCKSGLACLKKLGENETDTFNCTKYWSLQDGEQFDASLMRRSGIVLRDVDACKSHHVISIDGGAGLQWECRKAPFSYDETNLTRPAGDEGVCNFTTYDNETDKDVQLNKTDYAKCGFNKGTAAYCDKRKGDSWFQDTLKEVQALQLAEKLSCHAYSTLTGCGSAGTVIGKETLKKWTRVLYETDESDYGYALFADNDKCVAESITGEYWQGDSPDSALNSMALSSFAAMVLAICALFYMF